MANTPIDLAGKLSLFSEDWSPKVVARLNDYEVKVAPYDASLAAG